MLVPEAAALICLLPEPCLLVHFPSVSGKASNFSKSQLPLLTLSVSPALKVLQGFVTVFAVLGVGKSGPQTHFTGGKRADGQGYCPSAGAGNWGPGFQAEGRVTSLLLVSFFHPSFLTGRSPPSSRVSRPTAETEKASPGLPLYPPEPVLSFQVQRPVLMGPWP